MLAKYFEKLTAEQKEDIADMHYEDFDIISIMFQKFFKKDNENVSWELTFQVYGDDETSFNIDEYIDGDKMSMVNTDALDWAMSIKETLLA